MFGKIVNWLFGSKSEEEKGKESLRDLEETEDYDIRKELEEVMDIEEKPGPPAGQKKVKAGKEGGKEKAGGPGKGKKGTDEKESKKKKSKKKKEKKKPSKKKEKKAKKKKPSKKKKEKKKSSKKKKSKGKGKKKKTKKEQIVPYLKSRKTPATKKDVAENVGVTESTARRYLYYLQKDGKVEKTDDGWVNT